MFDACHAAWDCDGSEAGATIESIMFDACNATWDCDRCEAGAIIGKHENLFFSRCQGL